MGRAKLRMELISNRKSRQTTFTKRKLGMKKKAEQLQTLCDVEVCYIVFGPSTDEGSNPDPEAEIWPDPEKTDTAFRLIDSFKNQSPEERMKRTQTLSSFFTDRNQKIEDSLVKLRKKNDEATSTYSTWDDSYSDLSIEQLRGFEVALEGKIRDVKGRIDSMKGSFLQCQITQNLQWEELLHQQQQQQQQQQQPISMLDPGHDQFDLPFHCTFDHHIPRGIQIDANLMANRVTMIPKNYGNHYHGIDQHGGASGSKLMCSLPLQEWPTYGYPLLENMMYNNNPLPVGYYNPNGETISPTPSIGCFNVESDLSYMDKYFIASEFPTNYQN